MYPIDYKSLEIVEIIDDKDKTHNRILIREPFEVYTNLKDVRDAYNGESTMFWHFAKEGCVNPAAQPLYLVSLDCSRHAVVMPYAK